MDPRITKPTLRVLEVFMHCPEEPLHGFYLMREANVGSGTLYPLLQRLESAGWLESKKEDVNPDFEGRPPRRMFSLTPLGASRAFDELEKVSSQPARGQVGGPAIA